MIELCSDLIHTKFSVQFVHVTVYPHLSESLCAEGCLDN